jgi:hypothetical protein
MKKNFTILNIVLLALVVSNSFGQGCVAVRNLSPGIAGAFNEPGSWQFSANYRYFHSYKHFVGTDEQTIRTDQKTNVINDDNSLILAANYTLNSKWSFSIAVPLLYIQRSSLYEHYGNTPGNPRFTTHSQGLGDIRLMSSYTVTNTEKMRLQVGVGIKLPTGNFNYQDSFHKKGKSGQDSLVNNVVDQSIQPGDGGFGVVADFNFNRTLSKNVSLYSNGMYMLNPRNTNGIKRSASPGTIPLSNEFSVADQFFARLGGQYQVGAFVFALGGRIEGIPARDLIGNSDGFRRPGYIISGEPSVFYTSGNHFFGLNVPIALVRNRTKNTIDTQKTIETGKDVHGDAAFADYLISITYGFRISKKAANPFSPATQK